MKHIFCVLSILALIAGASCGADAPNKSCPIDGKPVVAANTTTYAKTVALCCTKCKAKFDETPKAYLNTLLTAHSGQCPLSKKAITSPVNVTYKREVTFCSAECKAKFDSAPDKFIREVR